MSRKELNAIINKLGFTKLPNMILDNHMKNLSGAELLTIVAICRKTLGFGKSKDGIALSTFQEITGCSRSTITKALKNLEKRHLIIKERTSSTNKYGLNFSKLMPEKGAVQESNPGLMIEPQPVQNSDRQLVQKVDTQKKDQNKPKETTTSSDFNFDDSFVKVVEAWNNKFTQKVNYGDSNLCKKIHESINEFSVDEIIKAMENRLEADYYRDRKPYLLNNPKSFFHYPDTIRTDLNRVPKRLYTYSEMLDLKFNKGYDESDFKICEGKWDKDGYPMREYLK